MPAAAACVDTPSLDLPGLTDAARRLPPATIRVHVRRGPPGAPEPRLLAEQVAEFVRRYPRLTVALDALAADRYAESLASLAAAGAAGDAAWTGGSDAGTQRAAVQRVIAPLDALAARDRLFLGQYYSQALEGVTRAGHLYGLPFSSDPGDSLFFFNRALFSEAGAGIPDITWTLATLEQAARRVTHAGTHGYLPPTDYRGVLACVHAFGGRLISPDGRHCLLDSPPSLAALQWLYGAFHRLRFAPQPPPQPGAVGELFSTGRLASARVGMAFAAAPPRGASPPVQWSVIPHPLGPGGAFGGACETDAFSLVAATPQQPAAWAWVKWITREEAGIRLAEFGGTPGGRPDVYRSDRLLKNPLRRAALDAMELAPAKPHVHNTRAQEFEAQVVAGLRPLWDGESAPTPHVVQRLVERVQSILDLPPPEPARTPARPV